MQLGAVHIGHVSSAAGPILGRLYIKQAAASEAAAQQSNGVTGAVPSTPPILPSGGMQPSWQFAISAAAASGALSEVNAALLQSVIPLALNFLPDSIKEFLTQRVKIHEPTVSVERQQELSQATSAAMAFIGMRSAARVKTLIEKLQEASVSSSLPDGIKTMVADASGALVKWLTAAQQNPTAAQSLGAILNIIRQIPGVSSIVNNVLYDVPTDMSPLIAATYQINRGVFDLGTFHKMLSLFAQQYDAGQFTDPNTGTGWHGNTVVGSFATAVKFLGRVPTVKEVHHTLTAAALLQKAGLVPPGQPEIAFDILSSIGTKDIYSRNGLHEFGRKIDRLVQQLQAAAPDKPTPQLAAAALELSKQQKIPFDVALQTFANQMGMMTGAMRTPFGLNKTIQQDLARLQQVMTQGMPQSYLMKLLSAYVASNPEAARQWERWKETQSPEEIRMMLHSAMSDPTLRRNAVKFDPGALLAGLDDRAKLMLIAGEQQFVGERFGKSQYKDIWSNPERYGNILTGGNLGNLGINLDQKALLSNQNIASALRSYMAQRAADRSVFVPNMLRDAHGGIFGNKNLLDKFIEHSINPR